MRLRSLGILALLLVLSLATPAGATAKAGDQWLIPRAEPAPADRDEVPPGFATSARDALRAAERTPEVRERRANGARLTREVNIPLYVPTLRWEVTYIAPGGRRVVEVHVNGRTGRVMETWTGPQVGWVLARGYEPSVGGDTFNAAYVILPLCLLFLAPFFDPRRPFRLLHLDLLVLIAFGLSQFFLNRGELDVSVPLVYPFLLYLLGRLLLAGFRPRQGRGKLVPILPLRALVVGLFLLVGFRVALNVLDSAVMDVGFASVIGADRILHGLELYVNNDIHGDTYGPITYIAYVPFELLLPWSGDWDSVPAAHAAALTFDLLTILGLFLLGRRLRAGREGTVLGVALGFAWAAYPYSTYVLQANTNDGLVAMLLVYSLLALTSAPVRGAIIGLAAMAKFTPFALVPLMAAGSDDRRPLSVMRFSLTFFVVAAASVLIYLPEGGLREFYDTTIGFQLSRSSPFSLWGLYPALEPVQKLITAGTLLLAAVLFLVPRRRDTRQVAALGAAMLVGLQLAATHWFYFYLAWVAPLALIALLGAYRQPQPKPAEARARTAAGEQLEPVSP
ncbi:MAG TPA: glycosyltransferase 87 family protein [Thermoleophilaceae bacterium]|nr:glycosyltransferase 87 family protein [Thermoleophilaceae bacterium]